MAIVSLNGCCDCPIQVPETQFVFSPDSHFSATVDAETVEVAPLATEASACTARGECPWTDDRHILAWFQGDFLALDAGGVIYEPDVSWALPNIVVPGGPDWARSLGCGPFPGSVTLINEDPLEGMHIVAERPGDLRQGGDCTNPLAAMLDIDLTLVPLEDS
jgi:hypothetical protein